jgi:hypothetical protein
MNLMKTDFELIGSCAGILGSLLLALGGHWAFWGWLCFAVSNVAWVSFASMNRYKKLLMQSLCFMLTTAIGLHGTFPG